MQPQSKTSQALAAFSAGDIKQALKIASTFRIDVSKADQATLKRGFECFTNPSFYTQLGKDPAQCIEAAKNVFAINFIKD